MPDPNPNPPAAPAPPAETIPAAAPPAVPAAVPAAAPPQVNPQMPAPPAAQIAPTAPADTSANAATTAPDPTPASSAAPAQAAPPASTAAAPPKTSASRTLGNILAITASVLTGLVPGIPVGAISEIALAAEGGLRAIAQFLINKGADNALTEAQAEVALATLIKGLATLAAPLPTPESIEANPSGA